MKIAIITPFTESRDAYLHRLLTDVELEDKHPSQLLSYMRTLASTRVSDDVLRIKWLDLLSQQKRRILLLLKKQTLEELATGTDEAHDMSPFIMATAHKQVRHQIRLMWSWRLCVWPAGSLPA